MNVKNQEENYKWKGNLSQSISEVGRELLFWNSWVMTLLFLPIPSLNKNLGYSMK
jgi:hypothetical protein